MDPGLKLGMLHSQLQTGMWACSEAVNAALTGSWAMYMYVYMSMYVYVLPWLRSRFEARNAAFRASNRDVGLF